MQPRNAGESDDPNLENDIRLLDALLDGTILRLEGEEAFQLVDEIRDALPGAARKTVRWRPPHRLQRSAGRARAWPSCAR